MRSRIFASAEVIAARIPGGGAVDEIDVHRHQHVAGIDVHRKHPADQQATRFAHSHTGAPASGGPICAEARPSSCGMTNLCVA